MSSASKTFQSTFPPTSYLLTPAAILQILGFAFFFPLLRLLKSLLTSVHVFFRELVKLVVKPPAPCPALLDEGVDGGGGEKKAAEPEAWGGVRRLGGITLTITVSVGAVRLIVVTVTIVALTLWVPLYPSARSILSLFDRLCRAGGSSEGRSGFVVDIRVGP
jgi:hypothetical protein